MSARPFVSVIVPTHRRPAALRRALAALRDQTFPAEHLEVIVVADGSPDETVRVVSGFAAPFSLRVETQPHAGAGAARNRGAEAARGSLLIFLDDDVAAAPGLVAAHAAAHAAAPGGIVIGKLPPVLAGQRGFFGIMLRRWWEEKFDALGYPGHRFHAFDLLSGNFSMGADRFRESGGFDASLRCHEDYELGVRLIQRIPFRFAPAALGFHHEHTDLRRALRRKFDEGQADVQIGRRHPQIRTALPLARLRPLRSRGRAGFFRAAFGRPRAGDAAARLALVVLDGYERIRGRRGWRRLLNALLEYWYWRGVAQEISSPQGLRRFIAEAPAPGGVEVDLDLSLGFDRARETLDASRPAGARLRFGAQPLARILPHAGAEPLRGPHLSFILAVHLTRPLLKAMVLQGAIAPPFDAGRLLAISDVPPAYDLREQGIELG